jgi:hypothetical protein
MLSLGTNDHFAFFALANTLGDHAAVIGQCHMNDASLVGRHRFHGERHLPGNHAFGHLGGKGLQGARPALFVPFNIDDNRNPLVSTTAHHQPDHILQGGQRLPPAPDEDTQIFTGDVESHRRFLRLIVDQGPWLQFDSPGNIKQPQKTGENIPGHLLDVTRHGGHDCGRRRVHRRDPNDGILCPEAKKPASTFSYDDYSHLVPA